MRKQKLIMLDGLPASGKSTFAATYVASHPRTVRVSKDAIRAMFGSKWSLSLEKVVGRTEVEAAMKALKEGFDVVVDDTNLMPRHVQLWQGIAAQADVQFETRDFPATIEVCVIRDNDRPRAQRVGRGVIERLALDSGRIYWTGKPIVIIDVDGTLADPSGRLPYIATTPKNYDKFYDEELIWRDAPLLTVVEWARKLAYDGEHEVVVLSGRPDTVGSVTNEWLRLYGIRPAHLFMRRGGDHRPDYIVKEQILDLMLDSGATLPVFAIDDRPSIVNMWRRRGIRVFPVHQDRWPDGAVIINRETEETV